MKNHFHDVLCLSIMYLIEWTRWEKGIFRNVRGRLGRRGHTFDVRFLNFKIKIR